MMRMEFGLLRVSWRESLGLRRGVERIILIPDLLDFAKLIWAFLIL